MSTYVIVVFLRGRGRGFFRWSDTHFSGSDALLQTNQEFGYADLRATQLRLVQRNDKYSEYLFSPKGQVRTHLGVDDFV